jgi:hypothetical protein
MDSRFALGCAISMNLVQFQSKLSVLNIFQQFGTETAGTDIVNRALRVQSFSCSYYGKIASRLVLDIFQCDPAAFCLSNVCVGACITKNAASTRLFVEDIIISSKTRLALFE